MSKDNPFFMDFIQGAGVTGVLLMLDEDKILHGQYYIQVGPVTDFKGEVEQEAVQIITSTIFDTEFTARTEAADNESKNGECHIEVKEIIDFKGGVIPNALQIVQSTAALSSESTSTDVNTEPDVPTVLPPEKPLTTCDQFRDYDYVAQKFIKTLMDDVNVSKSSSSIMMEDYMQDAEEISIYHPPEHPNTVDLPTIEDFTPEGGLTLIQDFICFIWKPVKEWHYTIYLILEQSDQCSDYYIYRTIWSLPNREYPVAQVHASIYFVIKVSRVKPINCLIDVSYYYEGCTYQLSISNTNWNEQCIYNILMSKLNLYQKIRF